MFLCVLCVLCLCVCVCCRWESGGKKKKSHPSSGSQVLLDAQLERLFLLFLPIVPSEQTEALPAAQKPANPLQRHSNRVGIVVVRLDGSVLVLTVPRGTPGTAAA